MGSVADVEARSFLFQLDDTSFEGGCPAPATAVAAPATTAVAAPAAGYVNMQAVAADPAAAAAVNPQQALLQ